MKNASLQKTRYSDEELAQFDQLIIEKISKSQQELDLYLEQIQTLGEGEDAKTRGFDDGVGTAESQRLYILAARMRKHIQHLENARLRIKNKVYGICRVSSQLISKERLKAVPHATLSIAAKQAELKKRK